MSFSKNDLELIKSKISLSQEIEKKTKVVKKSPVRLNLLQEVSRDNEILVTALVELAVIDSNGSVSKVPKDLLEKI